MQLNKSVSVWKNIWLTCSHRVEPCVVYFPISYLDWWIVAMITFMRLFSIVRHNVISKGCGCGGWKITLVTLVGLLSKVQYYNLKYWTTCLIWNICASFPHCVSACAAWLNVLSHCAHLWFISPLWMSRCIFRFKTLLNDASLPQQVSLQTSSKS